MATWQTKTFKTKAAMDCFIAARKHNHQITEIFVNNGYGVEYKKNRSINL